jgi:putative methyltransferase
VRNLYLVQVVDSYGPNRFLPLAVSYQWLYAQQDLRVARQWQCAGVLLDKQPIRAWVSQLQNPGMVAMSCYVWNWQYNCALAQVIKQVWPQCCICVGGPHVPKHDTDWMQHHPYFDVAVLGENENGFCQILANPDPQHWQTIPAVVTQHSVTVEQPHRTHELDVIPSPILTGFYDQIMSEYPADTQWQVTWESMRGCPYHCAFCDIGDAYWNKAYWFDMDRIRAEIEWMGDRQIEYVSVCDSNWGISERDRIITQWVINTKLRTGYPRVWDVTWAKNNRQRVADIAMMDQHAGTRLFKGVTFAVQSMDTTTLHNVDRFNLRDHDLESGVRFFREQDVATYTELIWPMPGETLETFCDGIQRVIDMGQRDFLMVHPLVLTPNAPMGQALYRRLHGIESCTVPLDTFWLRVPDDDYVFETVEAVTATRQVTFDDVLQGHMISYWLIVLYYYGWAHVVMDWLSRKKQISHINIIQDLMVWIKHNPDTLFGQEHAATLRSMREVFENQQPWGRSVVIDREFWEYKSATSAVFHNDRPAVRSCLEAWLQDRFEIIDMALVDINFDLCHDWRRTYPVTRSVPADLALDVLGLESDRVVFDHWDRSVTSDSEFVRVAYHYQRKNRYWRCSVTSVA